MEHNEVILRDLMEDVAKEQKYADKSIKIEFISSGGANYTSVLYNITISAPNKEDLNLFAKVANLNEESRSCLPTFIFDSERFVYRDLAEILRNIEKKCGIPEEERYVLPKFYGYNANIYEETIVLENLAAQGYETYDRFKSVDWSYASKAVETIANFHALAMAYNEQDPDNYNKLLKKLNKLIDPSYEGIGEKIFNFVETALSETREENKERLKKFFEHKQSREGNVMLRYNRPIRKPVLIHGDFRPSNIMHKVNEDGTVDLILLDYQTIQAGNTVADLLYFIFSGTDAEFRAAYYQPLIDHYYDSLKAALLKLRLNPEKIYPREDFDYELQEALPFGLVSAMIVLPIVTVEPENAPDIKDDVWDSLSNIKTGRYYPERLNGIIDDYVKWGVL